MVLGFPIFNQYVCPSVQLPFSTSLPVYFLTFIVNYVAKRLLRNQYCYPQDYSSSLRDGDSFDFIVVGAGPGGATVTYRLTENPNVRVLMVEAGREPSINSDIPGLFVTLQKTSEDWQYLTEPSPHNCLGFKDGRCRWPRGKVLGGSATIDAMFYVRGNKLDYDTWAAMGNDGWDYDSILPYYQKVEMVANPKLATEGLYGTKGALYCNVYDSSEPIVNVTKTAALELGYNTFNTQPLIGSYEALSCIKDGNRYTSAQAHISAIKERKNLFLAMNCIVTKILINPKTNAAEGVELLISGKKITVKATKEVILSAGAINTPQILMLSGIGPKDHLTELGIPVIKDLQVGKNLQDHITFLGLALNISSKLTKPKRLSVETVKYLYSSTGFFSQTNILNFLISLNVWKVSQYPDVHIQHIIFDQYDTLSYNLAAATYDQNGETSSKELEYLSKSAILKFLPTLLNMTSRGEIKLNSTNPLEKPLIYPNYYTDPDDRDIETMYKAIEFLDRLLETKTFSAYDMKILKPAISDCDNFQFKTKDYWKCALRYITTSMFDPVGTCKMGPPNDPGAVVNSKLEVYGVVNLRILDGSIMPKLLSAFTMAGICVIGEKGADAIKQKWSI